MVQLEGKAGRNQTQIAIRKALDHALAHGDDVTASHLARILSGMAFMKTPGLVRQFPGRNSHTSGA